MSPKSGALSTVLLLKFDLTNITSLPTSVRRTAFLYFFSSTDWHYLHQLDEHTCYFFCSIELQHTITSKLCEDALGSILIDRRQACTAIMSYSRCASIASLIIAILPFCTFSFINGWALGVSRLPFVNYIAIYVHT